jgi:HPt (histidine-containing phosphotransfer) domain-containing protein
MKIADRVYFDKDSALARVGGDRELYRELAGIFIEECPVLLAELSEAIGQGDYKTLVRAAHTLKGRAAFLGAATLEQMSLRLETTATTSELIVLRNMLDSISIEAGQLNSKLKDTLSERL